MDDDRKTCRMLIAEFHVMLVLAGAVLLILQHRWVNSCAVIGQGHLLGLKPCEKYCRCSATKLTPSSRFIIHFRTLKHFRTFSSSLIMQFFLAFTMSVSALAYALPKSPAGYDLQQVNAELTAREIFQINEARGIEGTIKGKFLSILIRLIPMY